MTQVLSALPPEQGSSSDCHLRRNEPLSLHSSWRIGGLADYFVEPANLRELSTALEFAHSTEIPWLVIGEGTNLLFADEGYRGVVIKMGAAFSGLVVEGNEVEAQCGIPAYRLARAALRAGLSGIEHIVGIPGTLGGLIVMNGGSLRKSISENLLWVDVLKETGAIERLDAKDCGFAYRASYFQSQASIVMAARLRLCSRPHLEIRKAMLQILRDRRRKFPRKLPNCGSVFKSSPELYKTAGPPGKIIEDCGLKGMRSGGAQVCSQHANFIINTGGATARDALELIREIRLAVYRQHGVWMDTEVKYVRPQGEIVSAHQA